MHPSSGRPIDPRAALRLRRRVRGQTLHLRIALGLMLALVPLGGALADLEPAVQLGWVLLPIAFLGVLHGGADPWVGRSLMERLGWTRPRVSFYSLYVSCMLLVVFAWWQTPLFMLSAFLVISILHFGEQDADAFGLPRRTLDEVVFGSIPVLGPIAAHPGEVATIFGWLTGADALVLGDALAWLTRPLVCLWLIGIGMVVGRVALEQSARRARRVAGGATILVLVMASLPPLIAFAAYFCLLHSFGHVLDMASTRDGPWARWSLRQWSLRLWPATLGAIALGVAGAWLLGQVGSINDPNAISARAVFWGLAALTVPHVLLHDAWRRCNDR